MYENSGAPKKVAADCEVAKTEIATLNIGIEFEPKKYSRVEFICLREKMYELSAKIRKYPANTSQSREENVLFMELLYPLVGFYNSVHRN